MVALGIELRISGFVARNSDHKTTEAVLSSKNSFDPYWTGFVTTVY
jgi:hypothetical protein